MKIRKHKSNHSFNISFQTRSFAVVKNKGNVGGWEQRGEVLSGVRIVSAEGVSAGAVRNGFLFGRDRNNTIIRAIRQVA